MNSKNRADLSSDPPIIMWAVVEVTIPSPGDDPRVHVGNLFADQETAKREVVETKKALERVEEEKGEQVYHYFDAKVEEVRLSQYRLEKADEMDEESFEILQDAADAVSAGLLGFEP